MRRVALLVVLVCLWSAAINAAEATRSGSSPLDVEEVVLDNGLRIFVVERSASPTFAAIYRFGVGGALDPKGRSGIAHLLEHMMFKGSSSVGTVDHAAEAPLMARIDALWDTLQAELDKQDDPFSEADESAIARIKGEIEQVSAAHKELIVKNEYDELMTRAGGVFLNAATGRDATHYFIQLPANRLELWFRLEADRLMNPVFREFYSERDVVRSERRQTVDSSPRGLMREALSASVFRGHPYGSPVIGWASDIGHLRRTDAEAYFRTYYSPANCTMVIVGDVKAAEVKRLAEKYLSDWQRQEIPPPRFTAEPEQKGERRTVVEFDAEPQITIGWPTVREGHSDQYPLEVLAGILGGLWSSRLDRTVVQQERIASDVAAYQDSLHSAGAFMVSGTVRGQHTLAELEGAIEREITAVATDGVTAEELERAKIATEVRRVRTLQSNLGQAFSIVTAASVSGDPGYIEEYERRIYAVTATDVQRVAKEYLQQRRKSVVELVKTAGPGGRGALAGEFEHHRGGSVGERGARHSAGYAEAMKLIDASPPVELTVPEIGKDVERIELASGATLFVKEDHSAPSIDVELRWLGGSNSAPVSELAAFELASQLLTEGGTETLDPRALEARKDELGMQFSIGLGETESSAVLWSLGRNFAAAFDLAAEMMTRPRLDGDRLETIKGQYIDRMKRRSDNPRLGAYLLINHVFDHDHPRLGYTPSRKEIEAVTSEKIRTLWQRYLGVDNLYITVVGDFARAEMVSYLESKLADWKRAENSERVFITREPVVRPGIFIVEKDLPNCTVVLSQHLAMDRTATMADHAAVEILNDILGGSGFRSRLMERLRSDEGLTYGIGSRVDHQGRPGQPGAIRILYQTRKETVARSINSVLEEYTKIIAEEVSKLEVEEQTEAWTNRFIFQYANDFYSVDRLMANELDDRPYDFDRQELADVQKVGTGDVQRVAKALLDPAKLTIAIFGELTDADRESLAKSFPITVVPRDEVFSGGFDVEDGLSEASIASP